MNSVCSNFIDSTLATPGDRYEEQVTEALVLKMALSNILFEGESQYQRIQVQGCLAHKNPPLQGYLAHKNHPPPP